MPKFRLAGLLSAAAALLMAGSGLAQDSGQPAASDGPSFSLPPEGNPLQGLFTPQPQYPTPQSHENPQPYIPPGNEDNAIKALFNVQPQYPTPQNPGYNTPDAPKGENHLNGLFTGQPQFPTAQTKDNPQPQPKFMIPGYNTDKGPWKPGQPTDGGAAMRAELAEKKKAEAAAAAAKDSKDKDKGDGKDKVADKGKDGKDKTKDSKDDKDKGKDKDKEKKEGAEADKEKGDKDKETADKDKEGGDKDKESADKDKEGSDKDKETADKDKDKDKEEQPPLVYNPLQNAIFFMNNGKPQQAINTLSALLKANPSFAEAHYLKAVALVGMRQFTAAAEEYRTVLQLRPSSPLANLAAQGLKKIDGTYPEPPKLPPLRQ